MERYGEMTYSRVSCAEGHPCSCMMGETGRRSWLDCEAVSNLRIHASRSTEISGIGTSCCTAAGRQNDAVAARGPLKPPEATWSHKAVCRHDITKSTKLLGNLAGAGLGRRARL